MVRILNILKIGIVVFFLVIVLLFGWLIQGQVTKKIIGSDEYSPECSPLYPIPAMPNGFVTGYTDDFEYADHFQDLFPEDKSRYTAYELTSESNRITPVSEKSHSGGKSIKLEAINSVRSPFLASKATIYKRNLYLKECDVISASGWYYLAGEGNKEALFIMDIEGEPGGDLGKNPGIRLNLALSDGKNYLAVDRGKFGEASLYQPRETRIEFPRDKWANVRWEIKLARDRNGAVDVWQDDVKIISVKDVKTMPTDIPGYIEGTNGVYNSFEIGITANAFEQPDTILYVDDVSIVRK